MPELKKETKALTEEEKSAMMVFMPRIRSEMMNYIASKIEEAENLIKTKKFDSKKALEALDAAKAAALFAVLTDAETIKKMSSSLKMTQNERIGKTQDH